jgi:gamma-glutamyl:cysteine ligase YbdK (ATP-grasp superfamily)
VLAEEWVNARGAIARFERMAIEIRVLDVQECPAMDIAFARVIIATLRALCAGRWADPRSLQHWRTQDLARFFDAAVTDAEATDIHDSRYLAAIGYPGSHARVAQVWGHLAELAAEAGELDRESERSLEHYLREGSLATRITRALPAEPARDDLVGVYRELCDCLAQGRPFSARRRG